MTALALELGPAPAKRTQSLCDRLQQCLKQRQQQQKRGEEEEEEEGEG